ncbi:hypothetical protein [Pseudomonas fluorescens]|uniref:hypothetical protein n=1 Tax=Pseudomonas fluorescens TaxID=294 RepID=UPI00123F3C5F|nr:hypothetical protein [Pseudomonas fluorescens]
MDLVDQLQKIVPWAAELPLIPKILVSLVIAGATALFLTVIWTTPGEVEKQSVIAVKVVLKGCYRRAVFTRTHQQLDHEAMFSSIAECRELVQKQIPEITNPSMAQPTADLMSALEGIERERLDPLLVRVGNNILDHGRFQSLHPAFIVHLWWQVFVRVGREIRGIDYPAHVGLDRLRRLSTAPFVRQLH